MVPGLEKLLDDLAVRIRKNRDGYFLAFWLTEGI